MSVNHAQKDDHTYSQLPAQTSTFTPQYENTSEIVTQPHVYGMLTLLTVLCVWYIYTTNCSMSMVYSHYYLFYVYGMFTLLTVLCLQYVNTTNCSMSMVCSHY